MPLDYFGFLVVAWLALILLNVRRHLLGIKPRLEKKEVVFWTISAVAGIIYIGDYIASHWTQILIPIPQTNATSFGYVTVLIPRVSPPLPLPILYVLGGFVIFGIIAEIASKIYNELHQKPPPQLEEKPASFEAKILEKKSSYDRGHAVSFWARFTGELKNGGFTAKVEAPDGTTDWWADELMKRALNGSSLHERKWDHEIPQNYPIGQSKVAIQVYGVATETPPDPIEDFFVVELGARPAEPPTEITNREKEDFKNGVATEVHSLLKLFIDPIHHWDINYPSWSSKAEQSKAAILGKVDYLVLRSLYDAIEERNTYFARRDGMSLDEVDPLNRRCVEAFSRAYSEVTWLKIASDTDSLLSNARKNVGLL